MARPRDENKRDIIREAAVRVIARTGFHNATTDKIAEAAGVSVGTIYNYFQNKDEILANIFQSALSRRINWFKELQSTGLSTYEKLSDFVERHFRDLAAQPDLARILVRERSFAVGRDPQALQRYMELIPQSIEELLRAGQQLEEVRSDIDPKMASLALFGALEAATRGSVDSGGALNMEKGSDALLKMVWNGLAAASQRSS